MIDLSDVGLDKIAAVAEQESLSVSTTQGDITETGIEKEYNVIISAYVLHHINDTKARELIDDMQTHTLPGGVNVIGTFTKDGDFYRLDHMENRFFPEHQELPELYQDWEILSYEERQSTALRTHEDGTHMTNTAAILLARKPS